MVHGIPSVTKQWRCVPGSVCTPSLHLDSSPNWDFQTHCARKHRPSGQYFGSVQKREMEEGLQDCTVTWPRSTSENPGVELEFCGVAKTNWPMVQPVAQVCQLERQPFRGKRPFAMLLRTSMQCCGHAFNLYNVYHLYSICLNTLICIVKNNMNAVNIYLFLTLYYIQLNIYSNKPVCIYYHQTIVLHLGVRCFCCLVLVHSNDNKVKPLNFMLPSLCLWKPLRIRITFTS